MLNHFTMVKPCMVKLQFFKENTMKKLLLASFIFCSLNATEVTYDKSTSLLWQDNGDSGSRNRMFTYEEAKSYCENLVLGEYSDFKIPSIFELQTLIDYRYHNPAMLRGFKNVLADEYWTSTPYAYRSDSYWTIDFKKGTTEPAGDRYDKHLRCVQRIQ